MYVLPKDPFKDKKSGTLLCRTMMRRSSLLEFNIAPIVTELNIDHKGEDFPGGPMVRTPPFKYRGCRFDP